MCSVSGEIGGEQMLKTTEGYFYFSEIDQSHISNGTLHFGGLLSHKMIKKKKNK